MKLEFKPVINSTLVSLDEIDVGEVFIYGQSGHLDSPVWMKTDSEDVYLCIESNGDDSAITGYTSSNLIKRSKIWKVLDTTLVIHNHVVHGG